MRLPILGAGLLGLTLAAAIFAAEPAPTATPRPEQREERERERERDREREQTARPDRIGPALDKRIRGRVKLDDVRVDVVWSKDGKMTSARVFGDGVGIWDRRKQFRLEKTQVLAVLKSLRKAKFGSMPDWFGESEGDENEGPRLKGRIEVVAGSISKTVVQLFDGDQSEEFGALAQRLLEMCAEPARSGMSVASLAEGLQKVAAGELAPQALAVTVQRRAAHPGDSDEAGWILHLEGRGVVAEILPAGKTTVPPRRLTLPEKDFRELANLLSEARAAEIPLNVYGAEYTDLELGVLHWSRAISARRFLNMTPATKGEAQQAFDRIYEAFRALDDRVRKEGEPASGTSSPAEAPKEKSAEKPKREAAR